MATIKSYTDLNQSRKLEEILPLETADYCWGIDDETLQYNNSPYPCAWKDYTCKEYYIPCWSLAALLSVLPHPSLHKTFSGWRCDSYDKEGKTCRLGENADNPIDACYEMILKLHERNLL